MRLSEIKFVRTPVVFAVVFTVFSLVLSLAGPRLHIATDNAPLGELAPVAGRNGKLVYGDPNFIAENLPSPGHGAASNSKLNDEIIPSGDGGYITWYNLHDNMLGNDVFAVQKFDVNGAAVWGDGVGVNQGGHDHAGIVTDGAGGVFAYWNETSGPNVFVQRVDAAGSAVFPSPVAAVTGGDCLPGSGQVTMTLFSPQQKFAVADGAGGVIVAWAVSDPLNPPTGSKVCAQRVNAAGARLWGTDGAPTLTGGSGLLYVVSDGANGAFVGESADNAIIHRLQAADGTEAAGCGNDAGLNDLLGIAADGAGGAVVVGGGDNPIPQPSMKRLTASCSLSPGWSGSVTIGDGYSYRSLNVQIFTDKILLDWNNRDVPQNAVANLFNLADGTSVWQDAKLVMPGSIANVYTGDPPAGFSDLIYAVPSGSNYLFGAIERIDASSPAFLAELDGATGAPVVGFGDAPNPQSGNSGAKQMVASEDGSYLTWYSMDGNIYVQKFTNAGVPLWGRGVPVGSDPGSSEVSLVTDGTGGAFVSFTSFGGDVHVYVARVTATGKRSFATPVTTVDSGSCLPQKTGSDGGTRLSSMADGADGVIVIWGNREFFQIPDTCVQRFDPSGNRLWGDQGIDVGNPGFNIATDGSGGAFVGGGIVSHIAGNGSFVSGCQIDTGEGGAGYIADDAGGFVTVYLNGGAFYADRFNSDCSHNGAWPVAGVAVGGSLTFNSFFGVKKIGTRLVSMFQGAFLAQGPVFAQLTEISDGTADWSGNVFDSAAYPNPGTLYDWVRVVPSGTDFLFVGGQKENSSPTAHTRVNKLDGATGAPAGGFGGEKSILNDGADYASDAVTDGTDGVVVDYRIDGQSPLFAQHFDGNGSAAWSSPDSIINFGATKTILSLPEQPLAAVSDGADGIVFVYAGAWAGDLQYAQRYDANGNPLWSDMNPLLSPSSPQATHTYALSGTGYGGYGSPSGAWAPRGALAPDGARVLAWTTYENYSDNRLPNANHTYMELLGSNGALIGSRIDVDTANGGAETSGGILGLETDATGIYTLFSHTAGADSYLAVQKYDLNGAPLWVAGGVRVNPVPFSTDHCSQIAPDGTGGVFVTYCDTVGGWGEGTMYANRIASNGTLTWGANGTLVSSMPWQQPYMQADSLHGIYIAYFALNINEFPGDTPHLSRLDAAGNYVTGFGTDNGIEIGRRQHGVVGLYVDRHDNAFVEIANIYNGVGDVQKVAPTGALLWGDYGIVIDTRSSFGNYGSQGQGTGSFKTLVSDDFGGVIVQWNENNPNPYGPAGQYAQRIDANGNKQWGPIESTNLTAPLAGGETTIAVSSTSEFLDSGAVTIGGIQVLYGSKDGTHFIDCVGAPAAASGASAAQMNGLPYNTLGVDVPVYSITSDGNGGAVAIDTMLIRGVDWKPSVYLTYIDASGSVRFGGSYEVDGYDHFSSNHGAEVSYNAEPIIMRDGDQVFIAWLARRGENIPVANNVIYMNLFAQQYTIPPPPHSPGSGGSGTPPLTGGGGLSNTNANGNGNVNAGSSNGTPVEPGTTDTTFHFNNPGNATTFTLYEAPPGSSMRPVATNNDPNATAITETGLTPNTTYTDRVITATANGTESQPSPPFPPFVTLLPTPDSITPVYDPTAKTVSLTIAGNFPNLTVGQSGLDFVIKDASGKTLFDSGFIQTPGPGSLGSVNLVTGQSYTVTVTSRNSAGDLGLPRDYSITIPTVAANHANIVLTKTAEKTDNPTVMNTRTKETTTSTKEVAYSVVVANTGTVAAKNLIVTDPLPPGLDLVDGTISVSYEQNDGRPLVQTSYDPTTRMITATSGELKPNESFTITFVATPSTGTTGSVKNKAGATWEE